MENIKLISNLTTTKNTIYISISGIIYRYFLNSEKLVKTKTHDHFALIKLINNSNMTDEDFIKLYISDYKKIVDALHFSQCNQDLNLKIDSNKLQYAPQNLARSILYENFGKYEQENLDDFEKEHCAKYTDYIKYANLEEETTTETTTYDANSFHLYCLSLSSLQFVNTTGNKEKITEIKNKFDIAYYLIECDIPPFYVKDKIKSSVYWVTNFDLCSYDKLNVKYALYQNSDYNAYTYKKTIRNKYFENNMKKIFELKSSGNIAVKYMSCLIVGLLCQKEKKTIKNNFDINDNDILEYDIDENGNDVAIVANPKYKDNDLNIKYKIARNQKFIYSFINYTMVRLISKVHNAKIPIYRIYCDSITCEKNEYMDNQLGDKFGQFKIENKDWNNTQGKFINNIKWIKNDT